MSSRRPLTFHLSRYSHAYLLRSSQTSTGSELAPIGSKLSSQLGWVSISACRAQARTAFDTSRSTRDQSSWCIPLTSIPIDADPASLQIAIQEQVATIPALRRLFKGKQCAASLPMAVSQLRWLDLPKVSDHEQVSLVCEGVTRRVRKRRHRS